MKIGEASIFLGTNTNGWYCAQLYTTIHGRLQNMGSELHKMDSSHVEMCPRKTMILGDFFRAENLSIIFFYRLPLVFLMHIDLVGCHTWPDAKTWEQTTEKTIAGGQTILEHKLKL